MPFWGQDFMVFHGKVYYVSIKQGVFSFTNLRNKHFHKYLKIDITKENDYLTCLNDKWKQPNRNVVFHILDESLCVIIWDKVRRDSTVRPVLPVPVATKTKR